MPSDASASTMASIVVCGEAVQPAWPAPLTPRSLTVVGSGRASHRTAAVTGAWHRVVRAAQQLAGSLGAGGAFEQRLPDTQEGAHMKEFAGRIAVVTGGGSGMGRELVRQLVAEACNVSMCDLAAEGMPETVRLCEAAGLPQGLRVTTHIADVSDFAQMERFRVGGESRAGHQAPSCSVGCGSRRMAGI